MTDVIASKAATPQAVQPAWHRRPHPPEWHELPATAAAAAGDAYLPLSLSSPCCCSRSNGWRSPRSAGTSNCFDLERFNRSGPGRRRSSISTNCCSGPITRCGSRTRCCRHRRDHFSRSSPACSRPTRSCGCATGARQWVGGAIFLAYLIPPSILFIPLSTVVFPIRAVRHAIRADPYLPTILIPFSTWLLMAISRHSIRARGMRAHRRREPLPDPHKIVLPLAVRDDSAFIFCFTLCWNEFIYALTFISSTRNKTVPVGSSTRFVDGDILPVGLAHGGGAGRSLPLGDPLRLLRRALRPRR